MVGECSHILLGEAERADPLLDLHAGEDTCGSFEEEVAVVQEARLESGVPVTPGWFVVSARDSRWLHNEMGGYCGFEGEGEAAFPDVGINLNVLAPGVPMAMYHEEPGQEDFLVLRGECLLIVEGQERQLKAWDFFHCPPHTKHVVLGAGDAPALVMAVGVRKGQATYPIDDTAVRHNAGVNREVASPKEAYEGYSKPEAGPAPELS
jgi:uncharacterized cupin superfamily protein